MRIYGAHILLHGRVNEKRRLLHLTTLLPLFSRGWTKAAGELLRTLIESLFVLSHIRAFLHVILDRIGDA